MCARARVDGVSVWPSAADFCRARLIAAVFVAVGDFHSRETSTAFFHGRRTNKRQCSEWAAWEQHSTVSICSIIYCWMEAPTRRISALSLSPPKKASLIFSQKCQKCHFLWKTSRARQSPVCKSWPTIISLSGDGGRGVHSPVQSRAKGL